jgi:hypothetical protein
MGIELDSKLQTAISMDPPDLMRITSSSQVHLNFLGTLLNEAYAHLHAFLIASVLGRKLFLMPFHMDVYITANVARYMKACLDYCKQVCEWGGGFRNNWFSYTRSKASANAIYDLTPGHHNPYCITIAFAVN